MAELSLILLPVSNDILMPEKKARVFSSSIPKQQHHGYQYPAYQYHHHHHHQQPQYNDQKYRYKPEPPIHETQNITPPASEKAETPQDSPRHSPVQSKLFEEIVAYQRYWEAIHQRTVKQLQWIQDAEDGIYTSSQLKSMLCASFDARLVP